MESGPTILNTKIGRHGAPEVEARNQVIIQTWGRKGGFCYCGATQFHCTLSNSNSIRFLPSSLQFCCSRRVKIHACWDKSTQKYNIPSDECQAVTLLPSLLSFLKARTGSYHPIRDDRRKHPQVLPFETSIAPFHINCGELWGRSRFHLSPRISREKAKGTLSMNKGRHVSNMCNERVKNKLFCRIIFGIKLVCDLAGQSIQLALIAPMLAHLERKVGDKSLVAR